MKFTKIVAAAAAIVALSTTAHAATLASGTLGDIDNPTNTSLGFTFGATGGTGTLQFVLDGFTSLDGANVYEDDFTLTVNGTDIFKATWDLGGGGGTVIYSNPNGASFSGGTFGSFAGGAYNISVPIALLSGTNTVSFNYYSLPSPYAGFQNTGDEGWGIGKYSVTTPVPEPANGALLLAGLGALGAVLRRRARNAA